MAGGYTISSQRQTTEITAGGRFRDVMEVTFVTTSGTEGTVRVPLSGYSADTVRAAVEEMVARIVAVEAL